MRYLKLYAICAIVFTTLLNILSCTKEDDYKKYVDNEERVYRAKAMELAVFPGYNRAEVKFALYNPVQVKRYEIYFDSIKVAEGDVTQSDTVRISKLITGLNEQTYTVNVYTIDNLGNKSVKSTAFLNVFGERFKSGLNQRSITKTEYKEPGLVNFSFAVPEANLVRSEFEYKNTFGVNKTVIIDKSTNTFSLTDLPETGNILYRTYILPTSVSLDTLEVATVDTIKIQSLIKEWYSSQELTGEGANNGRVIYALDGDLNTFWHTLYTGGAVPYPHWFIVDLGSSITINSFQLARRSNSNTLSTSVRIEVKDFGTDWKLVGTYNPANIDGYQLFTAQNRVAGRFVRYYGVSGPTTHTCVAEFKINP